MEWVNRVSVTLNIGRYEGKVLKNGESPKPIPTNIYVHILIKCILFSLPFNEGCQTNIYIYTYIYKFQSNLVSWKVTWSWLKRDKGNSFKSLIN